MLKNKLDKTEGNRRIKIAGKVKKWDVKL
jgi:hypothetical protein